MGLDPFNRIPPEYRKWLDKIDMDPVTRKLVTRAFIRYRISWMAFIIPLIDDKIFWELYQERVKKQIEQLKKE